MSPLVTSISTAFAALADSRRAAAMRAYLRGQFEFFGIPTPVRRAAVAALDSAELGDEELIAVVHALWDLPQRECQHAAIDLLARRKKTLAMDMLPPLLALVPCKAWGGSVDGLASVIGAIVRGTRAQGSQAHMDRALMDPSVWVRRVAMTHQLGWRLDTDRERLFRYALALAPEPDFFIRKAIGWALRDYARWDVPAVTQFVTAHRDALSVLTVREALKHHPADAGQ